MRIAIAGADGRMGRMLVEAVLRADDLLLDGAFDVPGSRAIGRDAADFLGEKSGVTISDDVDASLSGADMLIDFTRPAATLSHLAAAERAGKAMVIGTTGFDDAGKARIHAAAERIPIVFAPNMGVGVNALGKILAVAARILDEGYDVEVIEAHHRHKIDAPSGTALWLGEVVAEATGRDLARDAVYARHGHTGERAARSIGFSAIRGGDIVGDHTVLFAGTGERIEITHKSTSRASYAEGALRACRFLAGRTDGLFDMQDVLGLR
ncbi:MAG: 4-hydroxy-tetrahydrodipicolinate reductase [Burkholderiaceae bacterium]